MPNESLCAHFSKVGAHNLSCYGFYLAKLFPWWPTVVITRKLHRGFSPNIKAERTRLSGRELKLTALTDRGRTLSKIYSVKSARLFLAVGRIGPWYHSQVERKLFDSISFFPTVIPSRATVRIRESRKLESWWTVIRFGSPVQTETQLVIIKFQTALVSMLFRRTAELNIMHSSVMWRIEFLAFFIVIKNTSMLVISLVLAKSDPHETLNIMGTDETHSQGSHLFKFSLRILTVLGSAWEWLVLLIRFEIFGSNYDVSTVEEE